MRGYGAALIVVASGLPQEPGSPRCAMPTRRDFVCRIAVGTATGANSAVLRIWVPEGKSDVYAAFREIAGTAKVSLHASGYCHAGITSSVVLDEPELVSLMGGSRHQHRWIRRTHLSSKSAAALHVCFPSTEVTTWRDRPVADADVVWLNRPPAGHSIVVSCLYSGSLRADKDWPGREHGVRYLASTKLPNGEKFGVAWEKSPTTSIESHIFREARRRYATEAPLQLDRDLAGDNVGQRITAFGFNPTVEGYFMLDVAIGTSDRVDS